MLRIVRLAAALLGTWIYVRLNAPDWRNPYHLFYDVPTLPVAFACAGERLYRLCLENPGVGCRVSGIGDWVSGVRASAGSKGKALQANCQRDMRGAGFCIAAMLIALGCGCGAQY